MKYTDLKLYDFSRFDGNLEAFDAKGRRPSGLHVSGLVRAAYKNLKGTESKAIEGEQPFVRAAAGFMWERALEYAFTEYMQKDRRIDGNHLRPPHLWSDRVGTSRSSRNRCSVFRFGCSGRAR